MRMSLSLVSSCIVLRISLGTGFSHIWDCSKRLELRDQSKNVLLFLIHRRMERQKDMVQR